MLCSRVRVCVVPERGNEREGEGYYDAVAAEEGGAEWAVRSDHVLLLAAALGGEHDALPENAHHLVCAPVNEGERPQPPRRRAQGERVKQMQADAVVDRGYRSSAVYGVP